MKLSAEDQRGVSGNVSTGPGACQIVIIMKMRVLNVTRHCFRDMRYVTRTRLKKHQFVAFRKTSCFKPDLCKFTA